jgi:hypothetical protein
VPGMEGLDSKCCSHVLAVFDSSITKNLDEGLISFEFVRLNIMPSIVIRRTNFTTLKNHGRLGEDILDPYSNESPVVSLILFPFPCFLRKVPISINLGLKHFNHIIEK